MSTITAVPDEYDIARRAWNLAVDQRPAAARIARSVDDVQDALAHAREHGLKVAAQTTGHMAGGLPPLHDTLLLKTALHEREPIEVDPVARVARMPAGARWADVVAAVAPHGLAVMHGSSPTVSPVGYLLAGGLSFYGRAHGLAVNHVRAFEAVTPDGVARRASADEHPELFYALRGGGGGFAVVTAIEIGLLPYAEVTGGALFFDAADARAVLRAWRDWARMAPETITTTWRLMQMPPFDAVPAPLRGRRVVNVDGVALDAATAQELERALRAVATPVLGGYGPMPSAAVAHVHGDPEDPSPHIAEGLLLERLDDAAIEGVLGATGPGEALLFFELRQLGGALARRPEGAGARGALEGEFLAFAIGLPGLTGTPEAIERSIRGALAAVAPVATGTRLASFAERWGTLESVVPDDALERLAAIRRKLDADGLLVAPHLP